MQAIAADQAIAARDLTPITAPPTAPPHIPAQLGTHRAAPDESGIDLDESGVRVEPPAERIDIEDDPTTWALVKKLDEHWKIYGKKKRFTGEINPFALQRIRLEDPDLGIPPAMERFKHWQTQKRLQVKEYL